MQAKRDERREFANEARGTKREQSGAKRESDFFTEILVVGQHCQLYKQQSFFVFVAID